MVRNKLVSQTVQGSCTVWDSRCSKTGAGPQHAAFAGLLLVQLQPALITCCCHMCAIGGGANLQMYTRTTMVRC